MGAACGCVCVPQAHSGVVTKWGAFNKVVEPGFSCFVPCLGYSLNDQVSLMVRQLDVPVETKTRDNVFVTVKVAVQYAVAEGKVFEAKYKVFHSWFLSNSPEF